MLLSWSTSYFPTILQFGVLEQPTCRKVSCCLAREAEAGGWGPRFCPHKEVLESGVSSWVSGHSPFGPLCAVAGCVSEVHWGLSFHRVWGWDGACSLQGPVDGVHWGSLTAGNSPTRWLEKLRQLGEGSWVLLHHRGPREWWLVTHLLDYFNSYKDNHNFSILFKHKCFFFFFFVCNQVLTLYLETLYFFLLISAQC